MTPQWQLLHHFHDWDYDSIVVAFIPSPPSNSETTAESQICHPNQSQRKSLHLVSLVPASQCQQPPARAHLKLSLVFIIKFPHSPACIEVCRGQAMVMESLTITSFEQNRFLHYSKLWKDGLRSCALYFFLQNHLHSPQTRKKWWTRTGKREVPQEKTHQFSLCSFFYEFFGLKQKQIYYITGSVGQKSKYVSWIPCWGTQ